MEELYKFSTLFDAFMKEVEEWASNNNLVELKRFSELQTKEVIGSCYRDDQEYFEQLSKFKAKFFSSKNYLLSLLSKTNDRVAVRNIEKIISTIENQVKFIDTLLNKAKQRIKFYESVIYLVSNMSYGDY